MTSSERSGEELSSATKAIPAIASADATCNWVGTIVRSKCQILQAVRKGHAFQTLVVQNVRQGHIYQTVAEFIAKSQTDKDVSPPKKYPKMDDLSVMENPFKTDHLGVPLRFGNSGTFGRLADVAAT